MSHRREDWRIRSDRAGRLSARVVISPRPRLGTRRSPRRGRIGRAGTHRRAPSRSAAVRRCARRRCAGSALVDGRAPIGGAADAGAAGRRRPRHRTQRSRNGTAPPGQRWAVARAGRIQLARAPRGNREVRRRRGAGFSGDVGPTRRDARPRWIGSFCGSPGRRARRVELRADQRRGRLLHRRSAPESRCASAAGAVVRRRVADGRRRLSARAA